ncbi:MAG: bifunctional diguanylate cyclase/phosphodiesterase, partial [Thiohalophilus sp.]|uniref:putative bifunctional diguanylate cyclase/phosphodiesterase n=1 Tax=Thiohalophilus sp. TaxID=3028392 RepID=UPI0028709CBC
QQLRKSGHQTITVDFSITPLDSETAVIIFHDISHLDRSDTFLGQLPNFDPLTGLLNRDAIQQNLTELHLQHKASGKPYTVLLLDLDRFKLINDSYGHSAGDLLLQHIANQLKQLMGEREYLGRWGGEEFLSILPEVDFDTGLKIAEQIRKGIADFSLRNQQQEIFTTTSIGVASYPQDGEHVADILRVADAALYEAKRAGRNRISSSREKHGSFLSIATQLENALRENRIIPAYQPLIDLQTGQKVADEALARIINPDGEPLPAGQFIDAAVHLQLVHRIDYEVARQAILRCSNSVLQGEAPHPHFVNISAELLRHPELVQGILDTALKECKACGDRLGSEKPLVIEITEQALLHNLGEAREIFAPFLDFGLRLAIDDFGVGYSSLNYLSDLPVSFLKIDGQLIRRVTTEPRVRAIVKGIQGIASDLELITVGEFVEDQATVEVLREIGINWGQGYYFGKPQILHERFDI